MPRDGRDRFWLKAAGLLGLLAAGAGMVLTGWVSRSQPPPALARPAAGHAAPRPAPGAAWAPRPLGYSRPVRVAIPAIGVHARVIPLGENPDGTVAVPTLSQPFLTSWFDEGPSPGQPGPAALYGHVDTAAVGPAVFYRLGGVRPGDIVRVTRADHRVAVFRAYRIATYAKNRFPTRLVYGPTPYPELRLITCGGPFRPAAHSYADNVVVFARLAAVRKP